MARLRRTRSSLGSDRNYLAMAVRALARSDKTVAQIERLLQAKGASERDCRAAVRELERRGYLNDHAFAVRWAESTLSRRPMGSQRLMAELLRRGVDESTADRAVREVFRGRSEQEVACCALQGLIGVKRPIQLVRFLRQRGFDEDTIQDVTQINPDTESEA